MEPFALEQLTPNMQLMRIVLLKIENDHAYITPAALNPTAMNLPWSELGHLKSLLLFDPGHLLIQINTESQIMLLKAGDGMQKARIMNLFAHPVVLTEVSQLCSPEPLDVDR
jgi:hypothetical protein